MLYDQAYRRAEASDTTGEREEGSDDALPSWREDLKSYSARAVDIAIESGSFEDLRYGLHVRWVYALLRGSS